MSFDLRIEREIAAPASVVFDAFTDPAAQEEWYKEGPDWVTEAASDLRPGGRAHVSFGPREGGYREDHTFLVVERPQRLVYECLFTGPEGPRGRTTVEVTFEERDGATLLTIHERDFASAAERDGHEGGWPAFVDRLAAIVARRTAGAVSEGGAP